MITLSCDPGATTGWAMFADRKLYAYGSAKADEAPTVLANLICDCQVDPSIPNVFTPGTTCTPGRADIHFCFEVPASFVYGRYGDDPRRLKAVAASLITLERTTRRIVQAVAPLVPAGHMHEVEPNQWKGRQGKKYSRDLARQIMAEAGMAGRINEHSADAVCIGDFWIRQQRQRVAREVG